MRIKLLTDLLYKSDKKDLTSTELAQALSVSSRTILRDIKQANQIGTIHGFSIEKNRNNGYYIKILNHDLFSKWRLSFGDDLEENALIYDVTKYLLENEKAKLDDLAIFFHYSRSSMSRILSDVEALLKSYGVKLSSKPYTGLFIDANEIAIRNVLTQVDSEASLFAQDKSNKKRLLKSLETQKYIYPNKMNIIFLKYLFITFNRIEANCILDMPNLYFEGQRIYVKNNIQAVENIIKDFFPEFLRILNYDIELIYLAILFGQFLPEGNEKHKFDNSVIVLCKEIIWSAFERIRKSYQIDLTEDFVLRNSLEKHLARNFGGYLLGTNTENIFIEELKKAYPSAYYYALELAACISDHTYSTISQERISHITYYFAAAQERQGREKTWTTSIIHKNDVGEAILLKSRLESEYKNISIVEPYKNESEISIEPGIDFYISTAPIQKSIYLGKPVVYLTPFFKESDKQKLDDLIIALEHEVPLNQVTGPELFFSLDNEKRKDKVLEKITDELQLKNFLTEEEVEKLFDREALISTEIARGIAIPHCMVDGPSFISFTKLSNPVFWGTDNVELVILFGVHEGDARITSILERIFNFIQDENRVNLALAAKNYEDLISLLD